jgi:hypothetical protein
MLTEVDGRVGHDRSRAVVLVEMFRLMREVIVYRVARRRERASWRLQIRPHRTMTSCIYISIPSSMSRSAGTGTAFGDELGDGCAVSQSSEVDLQSTLRLAIT